MKKTTKTVTAIILAIVMLSTLAISICAAQPRYAHTRNVTVTLSFSSGNANCYFRILGNTNVTSITDGTMKLYDSNGNIVASWSNLSASGNQITISRAFTNAVPGETYTLKISATVKTDTSSEVISDYTTATY